MKRAASLAALLFLCLAISKAAYAQSSDFTIIAMPDVQNESQYYPQVLAAQTQWIANSKATLNIQAVLGLGDITNNGSDNSQWVNADAAYQVLDQAQIPYFLAIGNHDYDNLAPATRSAQGYNQWFGTARYSKYPWYTENYNDTNENFYGELNINGKNYLILVLEFIPRDEVVQWASSVLAENQDKEVILITHSYMYSDGTRVDQCDTSDLNADNYGDKLWAKLVSQYGNISLVLNGHITNAHGSRRVDLGVNGNLVNQVFSNYQLMANGGDGYLRILTFHPSTDTIDVKTYSPFLAAYMTDSVNQFTLNWHAPKITATTGTISGLVRDVGTCKPIAGTRVTVGSLTATTDSKGSYSISTPAGSYGVNATANDYGSGTASDVVNNGYATDTNFYLTSLIPAGCTLNSASPSVTICTPANNAAVTSPIQVAAGTTDGNLVSYTQLFLDGVASTKQNGGVLNTTATLTPGSHRIAVQSLDAMGTLFKQVIYVTVGTASSGPCPLNPASPTVTICTPANNATVTSPLTVTAGTTDSNTVSLIQLYVDGSAKVTQHTGTLTGSVTLTPGSHKLTVQAKDSTGTIFKQTIYVTAQ